MKDECTNKASHQKKLFRFYVTAKEIRKRLPIKDQFLLKLSVLQPNKLLNTDREKSFNDIAFIAKTISVFDEKVYRKNIYCILIFQ